MNKIKIVANSRWMYRCKSCNCLLGLVSVKPDCEYIGLFAAKGDKDLQICLQIREKIPKLKLLLKTLTPDCIFSNSPDLL